MTGISSNHDKWKSEIGVWLSEGLGLSEISRKHMEALAGEVGIILTDKEKKNNLVQKCSSAREELRELYNDIDTLERKYLELMALQEISRELVSFTSLKVILTKVVDIALAVLKADRGCVFLYHREKDEIIPESFREMSEDTFKDGLRGISFSTAKQAFLNRGTVMVSSTALDNNFKNRDSIIKGNIGSILAVPMKFREQTIGLLYFENADSKKSFSENDISFVESLANQAAAAVENSKQTVGLERETSLSRFLPQNIVNTITGGETSIDPRGQKRDVTVLAAKIHGFDRVPEKIKPSALFTMLNSLLSTIAAIIFKTNGTIIQLGAQGVSAIWGAPFNFDVKNRETRAVQTAIEIVQAFDGLKHDRELYARVQIKAGIALCSGQVIVGDIGSEQRKDYSVIGGPVTQAAALCSLAGGGEILVGEQTRLKIENAYKLAEKDLTNIPVTSLAEKTIYTVRY